MVLLKTEVLYILFLYNNHVRNDSKKTQQNQTTFVLITQEYIMHEENCALMKFLFRKILLFIVN